MRTEKDFFDWLYAIAWFYINGDRYSHFAPSGFLVAICSYEDVDVQRYVEDLEGGDMDASESANKIYTLAKKGEIWIGADRDPSKAMHNAVQEIRKYYYEELNNQNIP